ncbi:GIY-YIG nuclease family protein [Phenylobacterium sp.]|jgi:hypothetical protein|uniref:GIY-YIG nuclease family protein n=1 Tax=Phenylobacterium sp. TaxID=1871053 RepID=UPI002F91FC4C
MDRQARRDAIRDYKETKPRCGIFAVRCTPTGEAWVGASKNLDQQQNAIRFSLKTGPGGRLHPDLHKAFREYDAESIAYEILEVIDDEDLGAYGRDSQLKDRLAHWLATLNARKIFG